MLVALRPVGRGTVKEPSVVNRHFLCVYSINKQILRSFETVYTTAVH